MIPTRSRGRQSAEAEARYEAELQSFCDLILQINSSLDFRVSSRGWCYQLEEHGLKKGDFGRAQTLINDCRKSGLLPLDICSEDSSRQADNTDMATAFELGQTIEEAVQEELIEIENARQDAIECAGSSYRPFGFWFEQDCYIEMLVEKIDLKELFRGICRQYYIPLANSRGWPDLNSRAAMMHRFQEMENLGKRCVLLYCGDHDPAGLCISDSLRSMFADLSGAVGWNPSNLTIERFGLNAEFINENKLTWIDGLETGSGRNLEDPRHNDHHKPYVQDYLREFGARKVEANALVTRPAAGRKLCLEAICKYLPVDAPDMYDRTCREMQQQINDLVIEALEN